MLERKYLAHYIDAAFDRTGEATKYVRLGKDLEEFSEELISGVEKILSGNLDTEQKKQ